MTYRTPAIVIARRCADAYSTFRYASWPAVAEALLKRGLDAVECEAVMRSKWTRWAADASPARYGRVPAKALLAFMDTLTDEKAELAELVANSVGE